MTSGGPGDHPLTDILTFRHEVYGTETDDLIRKVSGLSSPRELDEWWTREIGWKCDPSTALERTKKEYQRLLVRAKENGWETRE